MTADRIVEIAKKKCGSLPEPLQTLTLAALAEVRAKEIFLLPFIAASAIRRSDRIPKWILDELALANLYGWVSYDIYDDFLDNEVGGEGERGREWLCVANYFLRELTRQYSKIAVSIPKIGNIFTQIMNELDAANAAESTANSNINPEISSASALADRSMGCALPAIAVFHAAGFGDATETALTFFRNYLAARQLHDDAHDWKEDLDRGRVNGAAARMFAAWRKAGNANERAGGKEINRATDMPELQKFFWHVAMPEIMADIEEFIRGAEDAVVLLTKKYQVLKNPAPFMALLAPLKLATKNTLDERQEVLNFLAAYRR